MTKPLQHGFTLVELMVALAVAAILTTVAIPGYQSLAAGFRTSAAADELLTSLQLARSEAIKRNARVTVCHSAGGTACAGSGDWTDGWMVFTDQANPGVLDTGETVLQVHAALRGVETRAAPLLAEAVSYLPSGRARSAGGAMLSGNITVCPTETGGAQGRVVTLDPGTGLPRPGGKAACGQ